MPQERLALTFPSRLIPGLAYLPRGQALARIPRPRVEDMPRVMTSVPLIKGTIRSFSAPRVAEGAVVLRPCVVVGGLRAPIPTVKLSRGTVTRVLGMLRQVAGKGVGSGVVRLVMTLLAPWV